MQTTGGRGRLASFQTVRIILLSSSFLKCSSWLLSSMVCLLLPLWLTVFLPPQLMFPFPPFELSCPFSETISSPATCRSWAQDHTLLSPLWHCLCMTAFITVSVCVSSVAQSCLTLQPMDYSPPGSSVHGIFQERILGWVAVSSPGDLPDPGIKSTFLASPALAGGFFTTSTTWEAQDGI